MTRALTTRFVLPGRWLTLETAESQTRLLARVRREAERAVGRADDRAALRQELRSRMVAAARLAKEAGARRVYLALQLADGVPFPATLVVVPSRERLPPGGSLEQRAEALLAALPGAGGERRIVAGAVPLVRSVEIHGEPSQVAQQVGAVQVNYWLAGPGDGRLTMFAFSCPLVALKDQAVDLFDAVMGTVQFPDLAGPLPGEGKEPS